MNISLYICMYLSIHIVKKKEDMYISLKTFQDKLKQNMKIHTWYKALYTNNSLKYFVCFLVEKESRYSEKPLLKKHLDVRQIPANCTFQITLLCCRKAGEIKCQVNKAETRMTNDKMRGKCRCQKLEAFRQMA